MNILDEGDEDDSNGSGGDEEDPEYLRDYYWKKTIRIGPSYQAFVPGGLSSYEDTLPYGKFKSYYIWDSSYVIYDTIITS